MGTAEGLWIDESGGLVGGKGSFAPMLGKKKTKVKLRRKNARRRMCYSEGEEPGKKKKKHTSVKKTGGCCRGQESSENPKGKERRPTNA